MPDPDNYLEGMTTAQRNLEHARHNSADCGDPDCEIHSPWVIEDEASRLTAIAWWIAGAKTTSSEIEDTLQGAFDAKLENIADENLAPAHLGGENEPIEAD